jgi:hypothetical protein
VTRARRERAVRERAAGPHAHAPEAERATDREHGVARQIALPDADAAGGQHDVAVGVHGCAQAVLHRGRLVARHAQVERLTAGLAHQRREHDGVRRHHAAPCPHSLDVAQRQQLVARRHDADARTAHHQRADVPDGCQHTQRRRAEPGTGRDGARALGDVLAARAHVASCAECVVAHVAVVVHVHDRTVHHHVLDAHHGVGAGGHRGAGGDAHRLSRGEHAAPCAAGGHRAGEAQRDGGVGARAANVRRPHRDAVHSRVVPRRERDRRHDVGRQHAPERVAQRDPLGLQGDRAVEHRLDRLGDAEPQPRTDRSAHCPPAAARVVPKRSAAMRAASASATRSTWRVGTV